MAKKPEPREAYAPVLRDVTARGIRTRALEAGSPDLPTLVLIHDLFTSHTSFEDIIEPLASSFHVIAPDLPGFGESEKPSPARYRYSVEAHAESVADLIAAFGVGRVSLFGHGMGGAIAITLAADHRELVQRLVIEDTLAHAYRPTRKIMLALVPFLGAIAFKQLYGRSVFRSLFGDEMYSQNLGPPLARIDAHYDAFNTPSARESAHAVMLATRDTRAVVARLPRVTAPTLVIWGSGDRIYPVESAHRLVREIRGARLEILDAGHVPHEERPRELLAATVEFLSGKRA